MNVQNTTFRKLKPASVALSQAAVQHLKSRNNGSEVLQSLQNLLLLLKDASIYKALDEKLADYVFFPLSHVLRQLELLPLRAQELVLQCINVLLQHAWKQNISPELAIQLLILIALILEPERQAKLTLQDLEECHSIALVSLALIFQWLGQSGPGAAALVSSEYTTQIGKSVYLILQSISRDRCSAVQLAALSALKAFTTAWPDRDALSINFFPGIISSVTKLLSPKPSDKTSSKVSIEGLGVLSHLLTLVLADSAIKDLPDKSGKEQRSKAWLRATVAQVKLALAGVLRLRDGNAQIRHALGEACYHVLHNSWDTFEDSRVMLLETMTIVSTLDPQTRAKLLHLVISKEAVPGILRNNLYNHILALPRIMLSANDSARVQIMNQISFLQTLLNEAGIDLSITKNILSCNLCEAITNAIKAKPMLAVVSTNLALVGNQMVALQASAQTAFQPVLSSNVSDQRVMEEMAKMLQALSQNDHSLDLAYRLATTLPDMDSHMQIAAIWTALQLVDGSNATCVQSYLDMNDEQDLAVDILETIYPFALSVIAAPDHSARDWRLRALCLEAIVTQARVQGEDFRPELIECLYPMVQTIGSSNPSLQEHAFTALDLLARYCGYASSSELIVGNADYMVNAVAFHLNTFDLSPQAPLTLLMMIRVSGASLLPYLDDLIESIFNSLELFHGYPKLVELLFEVLKSIIEEGAKAPIQLIEAESSSARYQDQDRGVMSISELCDIFATRLRKFEYDISDEVNKPSPSQPPRKGFAKLYEENRKLGKEETGDAESHDSTEERTGEVDVDLPLESDKSADSKIYKTMLNIARLTQYYLTSASVELRIKLLSMLQTAIPVLARTDDSFLPLINVLWPVLLPRLRDTEVFVVAGALDTIGLMCEHARGFLGSRIEEAWRDVQDLHARCWPPGSKSVSKRIKSFGMAVPGSMLTGAHTLPDDFSQRFDTATVTRNRPNNIIGSSLIRLLTSIVNHVRIDDDLFDEILQMLLPVLPGNTRALAALNCHNPDAVWLALQKLESERFGVEMQTTLLPSRLQTWRLVTMPVVAT